MGAFGPSHGAALEASIAPIQTDLASVAGTARSPLVELRAYPSERRAVDRRKAKIEERLAEVKADCLTRHARLQQSLGLAKDATSG